MRPLDAFMRELEQAQLQDRPVLGIRVTTTAPANLIVALPMTPERARLYAIRPPVGDAGALPLAIPTAEVLEHALEIVMHPMEWADLLVELEAVSAVQITGRAEGNPTWRVCGIPVRTE